MRVLYQTATAFALAYGVLQAQMHTILAGAGGTFPSPIYEKWIESFQAHKPGLPLTYEAVGSQRAIEKFKHGMVDFAALDFPLSREAQAELDIRLVPTLVGGAVPVYNVPGVAADLKFTQKVLADVYLGKIDKWDDPEIKALNRQVHLPAATIAVVHRSDGSGTTYVWTEFLSADPNWSEKVGASTAPQWPTGEGAQGNEGVAQLVRRTPFSIGYVEFIYALRAHLSYGLVKNPAGTFVQAGIDTLSAAASTAVPDSSGRISIVNAPGRNAYPIASFTWLLVPRNMPSNVKRERFAAFLDWALSTGQREVAALGYVPLPPGLAERERSELARLWTRSASLN